MVTRETVIELANLMLGSESLFLPYSFTLKARSVGRPFRLFEAQVVSELA